MLSETLATSSPPALAARLAAGDVSAALTFAGQGVDPLAALNALVTERPEVVPSLHVASDALGELAAGPVGQASGRFRLGLDPFGWAVDPDGAPPAAYLRSCAVSHPLILLTQLLTWRVAWADDLAEAVAGGHVVAASGHSQGLWAALAVAGAPGGEVDDDRLLAAVRVVTAQGLAMAAATEARGPAAAGAAGEELTPMASIAGVREERLRRVLADLAREVPAPPVVALRNTPTRFVVSGAPVALGLLRARLADIAATEERERGLGRRGGSPLRPTWNPLPVDVAFHSPSQSGPLAEFLATVDRADVPAPDALWCPVLNGSDAADLRGAADRDALVAAVARAQNVESVRWDAVVRGLVGRGGGGIGADWILDLGPGTDVARFSTEVARGSGARVLALASPEGRRVLATPGAAPRGRDVDHAALAPGVVEGADGRRHLDTRLTRRTGRPPVLLAGMTPTTADVPVVAAAARAGWAAELAGAGAPTAAIFERRIAELTESLPPGAEVTFNCLYLDRHLWDLQLGPEGMLWPARRAGAPIDGVTVSAGLPEVDEAVALLDRLVAHGMVRNAFKVGTRAQLRQVLAIADAAPHHTITVQVEGGKAGGHHSWEDLDDLLLGAYDELRRRPQVVLVAGGGIATPERAADLLSGAWAERHGEGRLPVDGVLVGTAAMAVAEATASPQVKRALVAATGTASWVARRGSGGGVTSGRSNLDADVHCLDNAGARAGHLLEEVAGDAAAVEARRDEIVAALALTAKPWFGEVEAMTYTAVLERFTALCAIGRHGRYDDGAWGDPSWRDRALALYRRFGARLVATDSGPAEVPVAVLADLDDPAGALAAFTGALPAAVATLVHPADADAFLAVCAAPGKPVPFVPALDAEVRRWYMADALWQAQDERYPADAVLVIPGPEAVAGITRVDEPVADLLARFEVAAVARALAEGAVPVRRDRLADPGPAPPHVAALVAGRSGPVADVLAAPSVLDEGRLRPNPLWSLLRPVDRVEVRVDDDGALVGVTATIVGRDGPAEGEHLTIRADGPEVVVEARIPGLDGPGVPLVLHLGRDGAPDTGRAWALVDGAGARARFAASALGVLGQRIDSESLAEPPPLGQRIDSESPSDGRRIDVESLAEPPPFGQRIDSESPSEQGRSDSDGLGAVGVGDRIGAAWHLDGARIGAYRALVGAAHGGVPLDLAFTLAWPALVRLLAGPLAPDLTQLLHTEHRVVPAPGWPPRPDEAGTATVTVASVASGPGGRTLRCRVDVASDRGPLAEVTAVLIVRDDRLGPREPTTVERVRTATLAPTPTERGLLADQPWWQPAPPVGPAATPAPVAATGGPLRIEVRTRHEAPIEGDVHVTAAGRVTDAGGGPVAGVALDDLLPPGAAHPVGAALDLLAPEDRRRPRPRRDLARVEDAAPTSFAAFARVGGDANPLHRSVLAARMAGLDGPVAHGLWTAARAGAAVVDEVAGGDASRLVDWRVRFTAPVEPGALLDIELGRVGAERGHRWVEVVVRADGDVVALGEALVAPPRTALLFPGQGIQRPGMGRDGWDRSAAARAVWNAADAVTRGLGFSILDVVDRNPRLLTLATGPEAGTVLRHPDGVLFLTELTQVALTALAAAQVAELDAADGRTGDEIACGHSIGEFNALVALGALPLAAALELVWERGRAMQRHVRRDADGASPYRLAVVDPSAADLDQAGVEAAVAAVAAATGETLEVVNHNAPGRQHAVVGTVAALDALASRLATGRRTARNRPLRLVPGIDVPFHSSVLAPAVADLRTHLDRLVPPVDPDQLVGRWIPNLLGRPFSLAADVVDEVARRTGDPHLAAAAAATNGSGPPDPAGVAHRMVLALLAHQLAAPVQWAATQHALTAPVAAGGLGVARMVEVAPTGATVLANLARTTLGAGARPGPAPQVLHVEADRDEVLDADEPPPPPDDDASPAPSPAPTAPPAAPSPDAPPAAPGAPAADHPVDAAGAARAVLALQARIRPDQLRPDESLDELFGGASSRRNQVLIDLGRELALSGTDGAQDLTLARLQDTLRDTAATYRFPGPYLRDTVAAGVARALGPAGLGRGDVVAHLRDRWGLGPGLTDHVLLRLALDTRSGASARGGDVGPLDASEAGTPAAARALVDGAVAAVAAETGIALAPVGGAAAPDAGDAELGGRAVDALVGAARDLAAGLGRPFAPAGEPLRAPDGDDRLARLDAELGEGRAADVAPRFSARATVRFASAASAARWDLVRAYHDALAGRLAPDALAAEVTRLARWGDDDAVVATARWLAERAGTRHGRDDVEAALRTVLATRRAPVPVPGRRPDVRIETTGTLAATEVEAPDRPDDLVAALDGDDPNGGGGLLARFRVEAPDLTGQVALVTGASPGSIAAEAVRHLLAGGARVVVTTSTPTRARRRWLRDLYRDAAGPGAELFLVPANLASFADVDALVDWLDDPEGPQRGRPDLHPGPLAPTLVLPFAAVPTVGEAPDAGAPSEVALRVQLLGVERLVGRVAARARARRADPVRVVLPLSPNHGGFGGDGAYSETKAALEVLRARRRSEHDRWGAGATLVGARIGWVRGTGLMGGNDAVAALVEERLGVRTFSAAEMGWLLATLATAPPDPATDPDQDQDLDLTGGLAGIGDLRGAVAPLGAELLARAAPAARRAALDAELARRVGGSIRRPLVDALPTPILDPPAPSGPTDPGPVAPAPIDRPPASSPLDPAEVVVIVGAAELGPAGTAEARFARERAGPEGLGAGAVAELAWLCGLIRYEGRGSTGRFVDAASGEPVDESAVADRYRAAVLDRTGLRPVTDDGLLAAEGPEVLAPVHLDRDLTFEVGTEEEARTFVAGDPARTDARRDPDSGAWTVTRRAGALVRVPRRVAPPRRVAGQLPDGLDLARFGLPGEMAATTDRLALVNLACVAEAFADAGVEPEELLAAVHPALVGSTQGSGQGGMASLRRLLLDGLLDEDRQSDRLQEALVNVMAAHAVQGYVGSYGPMVHPVAACATAAASLEEAHDKIRAGKALVVLAGGYDDLTPESMGGFADMHATVDDADLTAMGIEADEASRANDLRRRGFVESAGGGAALVVRGDVALALGLPVRAVLAYAGTFADGIQASIPAPGLGALACARGGARSPLAEALARHGLTVDDIAVVSKHDTSTELNDPNEADLHQRIQEALGRTPGNPLLVVSQKTVTGHPKGGAAAWQVDGVLQVMEAGIVPGNRALESVDPLVARHGHLAHGTEPVVLAPGEQVRAALVTSLGFGHVSAVLALAHPDVFLATVPAERRAAYLARAGARRAEGRQRRLRTRVGRPAPIRRTDRRLGPVTGEAARRAEAALLLDPDARPGGDRSA